MTDADNISGWIIFLVGLYALAAGIGGLRDPENWEKMMWEMERSRALQFFAGLITFVLGAVIYLVSPLNFADWLSILVSVLGGIMMLEGLAWFAFPDKFIGIARLMMGSGSRLWPILACILGLVLGVVGLIRLQF